MMWNSTASNTIYTILNLTSGFIDIIALMICLILLYLISYRLIQIKNNKQKRVSIDVASILCINTLCVIIMKSLTQIIHITVPTIKKDFHVITVFYDTFTCHFSAYLVWSIIGILYWSYTLLVFFRFIRVVYPNNLWLQRSTPYLYLFIPAQYILVVISLLPLVLIFHSIQPVVQEAYCSVIKDPFYHLAYTITIIFYVPMGLIAIFYACIVRKMRQSSLIRPYAERNRRDFVVIQRILLNLIVLGIVSMPYLVVYTIDKIIGCSDSLINRIQWMSSSIASILFSVVLPFITTHLYRLLKSYKISVINDQN